MEPYLGITAHYINDCWELKRFCLDIDILPHPHTGENIAHKLIDILSEYQILNKLSSITSDNGSNMISAGKECQRLLKEASPFSFFFHIRCCAHSLNLIVSKNILDIQKNAETIGKIRNLISLIRKSSKLSLHLKPYIATNKDPNIKPQLDVRTR